MATLLVHPSRGNRDGRVNLEISLARSVDFLAGEIADTLTGEQRAELLRRHPEGRARFWGTYEHNAAKIQRVREGAVVAFTGQGGVWALGVVGFRFENPEFAATLWEETEGKGTYRHIYSLARFEEVSLPYAAINAPLGNKLTNHFQGMAVYDTGDRAQRVIDALRLEVSDLEPATYEAEDAALAEALADEVASAPPGLVPIERTGSGSTTYAVRPGQRVLRRGEAYLVAAYAATLNGLVCGRHFTEAGVTDLWVEHSTGPELIEAKSVASRTYVRQALAQLLDYAPATPEPPTLLTALFPEKPSDDGVALLHRYGVDCLFRVGKGEFRRLGAPRGNRLRLLDFWSEPAGTSGSVRR